METQLIPVERMAFQGDHDGSIVRPDNSDWRVQLCTQPRLSEALIGSRRVKQVRHTSLLRGENDFSPKYGCSTLCLQVVHTVAKTPGGGKLVAARHEVLEKSERFFPLISAGGKNSKRDVCISKHPFCVSYVAFHLLGKSAGLLARLMPHGLWLLHVSGLTLGGAS
jgi:hypothetical protein